MLGVEFIDPKAKKDMMGSYPANGDIAATVQKICFKNGLIMEKGGRNGAVMRCLCALNITDEELNKGLDIFEKAVLETDKKYR